MKTSRRILTGSIAAALVVSLLAAPSARAQTTIGAGNTLSVDDPADKYLSASGGYLGTITIMDDATLKTEPNSQAHFTIQNNLVFGGAGGIRHLEFNNNDTIYTFTGTITSTGTGPQTLAIVTGVNGNGDREEVTFNNGIPNVADNSALGLDVTFNTQSGSYSFVNLVGVNGFQGNITLHKGGGVTNGYLTIGGRGIGDNGNQYQSVSGSGNLGNGNFSGNISIDDSTIFDYNSSSAQTLSGVISNGSNGAGQLVKEASGILTLTGVSTFTGATTVSGGTFAVDGAGQLGSGTYTGAITTSNGSTFSYNSTADQVLSGVFSGDGLIVKGNTSLLTLSGGNSGSGTTTVNGGVLRLSHASALSSGLLTVSGGVVELASGNLQRNLGSGGGEVRVLAGSSGFSARGAARTVTIGTTNDSLTWGSGDFAPGTLVLNATTATSKLTFANGLDLDGAARTISVGADTAEVTGAITGGAGSDLIKTGNGILLLSGAHTHAGTTTVTGGELALGGALTGGLTVNTGTTIRPLVGGSLTTPALTFDDASYRWLIGSATNSTTLNSHIQVNGNVSITGAPVLKVDSLGAAANGATTYEILKYTGTLSGGQPAWTVDLNLVNSSPIKSWADGNGTWDTAVNWAGGGFSGGQVQYDNANSRLVLVNLSSTAGVPVSASDVVIDKVGGANVTGPAAATTINSLGLGNGTNAISLTVQGGGPLTVTGATTINHATLTANDTFATPSVTSSGTSTVNGSGSVGTVGTPLSTFNIASGTTSFGGTVTVHTAGLNIGGTASLNTGSTVVTAGVTGAGTVNFNGGTLKAAADMTLKAAPAVIKAGGAVIDSNGHTVTIGQVFSNDGSGGGLTVQGAGTVLIMGVQTYTGSTNIAGGTLQLKYAAPITAGLNAWFDASTLTGTYTNGQNVTTWTDQSPGNLHAATRQGGDLTYVTNQVNGLPAVQYRNGGSAALAGTLFSKQQFLVLRNPDANDGFTQWGAALGNVTDQAGYMMGNDNGSFWGGNSPSAVSRNGAASNLTVTNNGQFIVLRIDGNYPDTALRSYWLGSAYGNGANQYNSTNLDVAEIISYDHTLSASDEIAVGAYLSGKFGLSTDYGSTVSGYLPTTTAVSISGGAFLDMQGAQQIASLAGAGTVTNNGTAAATLTLSGTSTTTFSGTIGDGTAQISLTKSGSGMQTLSGANTYTGATTVLDGTLAIGTGGSLVSPAITVSGTGVLDTTLASLTLGVGGLLTNDSSVIGAVTAGNGSTVRGGGTFTGNLTVNSGGVIKPGNDGSGTMTITGATGLTLQTGSAINWFLNSSSTGGGINITGSPVIAANVAFSPLVDPGATVAPSYTFMTWTGADPANNPVFQATAPAGTVNWTNSGDGATWDDAPNWDLQVWSGTIAKVAKTFTINGLTQVASAPVATSSVVIDGYNVIGPASAKTVANLTVQGGSTLTLQTAALTVSNLTEVKAGSTLTVNGPLNSKQVSVVNGSAVEISNTGTISTQGIALATNGSLSLKGGTLKATAASTDFLTVTAGASVTVGDTGGAVIDSNGFDITVKTALQHDGSVAQDDGLTKTGAGILLLTKTQTYNGNTLISGGTLKLQGSPTAPPVAGYARWFDASNLGVSNGSNVSTWNDLSGNLAHATVPGGNISPTYIADAGTGTGLGALHFSAGNGAGDSGALSFTRDSSIRTVFSIFKGSSFLLTDADEYHFHRPGDGDPTEPLYAGYASGNITGGSTYVNGTLVDGTTFNMPTGSHNGYNLVEVLTTGNVQADSFNKDRVYHAGDQSHAEMIIYNTVLSNNDRLAVESYLTAKWFGGGGGGGNVLPISTTVSIASGSTLDLNGGNQEIAGLSNSGVGGGNVINSSTSTDVTLTLSGSDNATFTGDITNGTKKISVVKSGAGIQDLNGAQAYDSLTASGGTTNVNGELGSTPANGTAAVAVTGGATLKFGTVSQTLSSLTIGAGSTVVFTSGTASGAFSGGGKVASLGDSGVVPEPGTLGLLVIGALGVLGRRRRQS